MKEMVGGCCVCSDERGWPDNPLVYCDGNGCTVAVHQACYGIVTVPTGPWYCRKCESPENKGKVRCELCPSRSGALKRTDTGGWAHVVCALYIPEVRFGNVTSMEPIVLRLIPPERYNKTCYICQDLGKSHRATAGACMQCNKSGCKQQFHVTCAQSLGLLCEEAGNYLDNVKYCGYCQHHYSKLFTNHEVTVIAKKKGGNVKTIPPYKPVTHDSHSSDSSGEKETEGETAGAGAPGDTTPTHSAKSKGPGRKSSHGSTSGKNTPSSGKQPLTPQPMDVTEDTPADLPVIRKHKNVEKRDVNCTDNGVQTPSADKKKSPARRGSVAGEGGGSKSSTPAPSPQHSTDSQPPTSKASTTTVPPAKMSPSETTPPVKPAEPVGVISSVTSAPSPVPTASTTAVSTPASTSVVQVNKSSFQESVITNTDAMDTKQTKKRKAVAAAQAAAAAAAAAAASAAAEFTGNPPISTSNDATPTTQSWEQRDELQEPVEKIVRRNKPEHEPSPGHFSSMNAAAPLPPPMPAHSPSHPSPRQLSNSLPGPSGMNPPPPTIRSPSHQYGARSERDGQASLLVSVPLPSTSYGINLSTQQQQTQVSQNTVTYVTSTPPKNTSSITTPMLPPDELSYYPPLQNKRVSLDTLHSFPPRSSWGGLNVQYEQQHNIQEPKPGVSGVPGPSKEPGSGPGIPLVGGSMGPMPQTSIRTKKRAAMSAAASRSSQQPLAPPATPMLPATIRTKKRAAMSTITSMEPPPPPPPLTQMASTSTQSLASVRRPQQPAQSPIYTETVKDSPPSSPGERAVKKSESKMHTAPHMLGNELNPESGVAARLQEQLTAELAAHAASTSGTDPLVPPPLINKASGGSRTSSAQSLDQLLERQWEQGSQFLMEQAQHFDIASLLSCLHQLRTENVRLEEHVANLLQRRDHLLAVNARLAIPLAAAPVPPPPPLEAARCSRENGAQLRPPPPPPARTETVTSAHHSMSDQRSHQRQIRGDERDREERPLRIQEGVVHLGTHPQRPVNMDAQLMMREVQQKPS